MVRLTEQGKETVRLFLLELAAKRKEILDAGMDIAKNALPTEDYIMEDVNAKEGEWDSDDPHYRGVWMATDNYEADEPLVLELGEDFEYYTEPMTLDRAKELLNKVVEHVSAGRSAKETIGHLLSIGFTGEELYREFNFDLFGVADALEEYEKA